MESNIQDLFQRSIDLGEHRTTFKDLDLSKQTISEQKLSCVDFLKCDLSNATFIECDLRGSSFDNSIMKNVKFIRCQIYGCEFPKENASITFDNCYKEIVGTSESKKYPFITEVFNSTSKFVSTFTSLPTEKILAIAIFVFSISVFITICKVKF